jgi:hypothetical protein
VKDDGWSNPGGDWIWLAPAEEFLVDGSVAPSIDPGRFTLSSDRAALTMVNRGEAFAQRAAANVRFRLTRRLRPLFEAEIDSLFGQTWLRRAGWEEEAELQVEGRCAVPVQLWSITQAPPGSEALAAHRRLACVEEAESERARLLVKTASAGSASAEAPALPSAGTGPVWLSFVSPPLNAEARGRVKWKTTTCSFSGRSAEVRLFAARMVYSPH